MFTDNRYSIEDAYNNSVGEAYRERDVSSRIAALLSLLEAIEPDEIDPELKEQLEQLRRYVSQMLEGSS